MWALDQRTIDDSADAVHLDVDLGSPHGVANRRLLIASFTLESFGMSLPMMVNLNVGMKVNGFLCMKRAVTGSPPVSCLMRLS